MKYCSHCHQWKDESEFSRLKSAKDGLQYYCKTCNNAYHQVYKLRYLEAKRKGNRNWRKNHKEQCSKIARSYSKRAAENLYDRYIIQRLRDSLGLPTKEIRQHPDLIERERDIIKIYRVKKQLLKKCTEYGTGK